MRTNLIVMLAVALAFPVQTQERMRRPKDILPVAQKGIYNPQEAVGFINALGYYADELKTKVCVAHIPLAETEPISLCGDEARAIISAPADSLLASLKKWLVISALSARARQNGLAPELLEWPAWGPIPLAPTGRAPENFGQLDELARDAWSAYATDHRREKLVRHVIELYQAFAETQPDYPQALNAN